MARGARQIDSGLELHAVQGIEFGIRRGRGRMTDQDDIGRIRERTGCGRATHIDNGLVWESAPLVGSGNVPHTSRAISCKR